MTEDQEADVADPETENGDEETEPAPGADAEDGSDEQPAEDGLAEGDFVRIDYTARTAEDDRLVDTTDPEVAKEEGIEEDEEQFQPRTIVLGQGHLFEAVEEDIYGKSVGDEGSVVVPAAEAFGEHDSDEVRTVSAEKIDEDDRYPGAQVQVDGQQGFVETIIGGRARVDFNHPLAGEDIEYEYEIVDVVEDRLERAKGLFGMYLDADLEMWIQTDEVEEERPVQPEDVEQAVAEAEAESDAEEAADESEDQDEDEDEPQFETEIVDKETLYIEATPQLAMNQQWMFGKQQIAQDVMRQLDIDRVIVQETIEAPGGMGGMGGMMGGMGGMGGGDVEDALADADVDADDIVEELEGGE